MRNLSLAFTSSLSEFESPLKDAGGSTPVNTYRAFSSSINVASLGALYPTIALIAPIFSQIFSSSKTSYNTYIVLHNQIKITYPHLLVPKVVKFDLKQLKSYRKKKCKNLLTSLDGVFLSVLEATLTLSESNGACLKPGSDMTSSLSSTVFFFNSSPPTSYRNQSSR